MKISDNKNNKKMDGKKFRFAVLASDFNAVITDQLLKGCVETLQDHHVPLASIRVVRVPGAFELPLTAQTLAKTKKFHAVIALGCVIRGETPHDRYISQEAARGLGQAALNTGVPMIFGVLTPLNKKQAFARAGKGREAAEAAIQMAQIMRNTKAEVKKHG